MSACPSSLAVRSSCSAEADRSADTLASSSAWLYRRVSLPRPAEADRSANTLASSSAWLYRRLSLPRPAEADRPAICSAWLYKWVSLPRLATRASVRASSAALAPPQAANPSTPAIATGAIHRSVLILEFVIVPPPWFPGVHHPAGRRCADRSAGTAPDGTDQGCRWSPAVGAQSLRIEHLHRPPARGDEPTGAQRRQAARDRLTRRADEPRQVLLCEPGRQHDPAAGRAACGVGHLGEQPGQAPGGVVAAELDEPARRLPQP